ncbi:CHAT domain-containing protein [Sorangium sp. So ce131]|uniref:CHAT domain-containing protein n=1 Tax=Sorangium sp. So ce131 TaxID=3133282 RepID=UPI003F612DCE
MPNDAPLWIEIAIENDGDRVFVTPRGSLGQGGTRRQISLSLDELYALQEGVGRAAKGHTPLDDGARQTARDLFAAIFRDQALEICTAHLATARPRSVVLRLAPRGRALQSVPWEVMLAPPHGALDTSDFLASAPRLHVVRAVTDGGPARPLRVLRRVRVLVIAAASTRVAERVKGALGEAVDARAVDLLEPIEGARAATLPNLRAALQRYSHPNERPHVVHIIGHGAVSRGGGHEGTPVIELPGDDGAPVEIPVQALADDFLGFFGDDLRLVVLDACEGAAPGAAGSAAEILARRAATAVIAHLWPLDTHVAGELAKSFYTSLTLWEQGCGDVAASLQSARRELLVEGAGAFSSVLYLRGDNPLIFDFRGRIAPGPSPRGQKAPPPAAAAPAGGQLESAEKLKQLLAGPFSVLLGDSGEDPLECQMALRKKIAEKLHVRGDDASGLANCIQLYALLHGRSALDHVFKEVVEEILQRDDTPLTPLAWELAGALRPGVHATLLWLPVLEHALAERYAGGDIYVVQPPSPDEAGGSLWVRRRKAGSDEWLVASDLREGWPNRLDLQRDFVILRLYGGYLPKREVLGALLTEDDHALNPRHTEMPNDWDGLVRHLRTRPTLVVGISVLDWRHRMVLRLLFDQGLPRESVAVLPLDGDDVDGQIWTKSGGALTRGRSRAVHVARQSTEALADMLMNHPRPAGAP